MITFTDAAAAKVREYMAMTEGNCLGVRVVAHRQGRARFGYELSLVVEGDDLPTDTRVDQEGFAAFVDPPSAELLVGTTVDFRSDFSGAGFTFDNPNTAVKWDDPIAQKVQDVLEDKVMPSIAGHGGWVDLVKVEGDAAIIEMGGGCQGCGMSGVTLKQGIEAAILEHVPEIKRVLDATDHESGTRPYYQR